MNALLKLAAIALVILACYRIDAAPGADSPYRLTSDRQLEYPREYRDWIFLSSGKGMSYGPTADPNGPPVFDNVFVNPDAYKAFKSSGKWPDQSIFVLEIRQAKTEGSINKGGHFQGDVTALEVLIKDARAFADTKGWGFYEFEGERAVAPLLGRKESCYACHSANAGVEYTFVQFYPTLKPIAAQHGTLRKDR